MINKIIPVLAVVIGVLALVFFVTIKPKEVVVVPEVMPVAVITPEAVVVPVAETVAPV